MPVRTAKVDTRTGDSTSGDGEEEMLMVSGVSRSHKGQVQLSLLRFDQRSRLQRFLLHAVHNTLEAYRITRRLGLPPDTITRKLPYVNRCVGILVVFLQPNVSLNLVTCAPVQLHPVQAQMSTQLLDTVQHMIQLMTEIQLSSNRAVRGQSGALSVWCFRRHWPQR